MTHVIIIIIVIYCFPITGSSTSLSILSLTLFLIMVLETDPILTNGGLHLPHYLLLLLPSQHLILPQQLPQHTLQNTSVYVPRIVEFQVLTVVVFHQVPS